MGGRRDGRWRWLVARLVARSVVHGRGEKLHSCSARFDAPPEKAEPWAYPNPILGSSLAQTEAKRSREDGTAVAHRSAARSASTSSRTSLHNRALAPACPCRSISSSPSALAGLILLRLSAGPSNPSFFPPYLSVHAGKRSVVASRERRCFRMACTARDGPP